MYICFRCWALCELSLRGLRFNPKLWKEHRAPWSVWGSPRGPDDAPGRGGLVTASPQPRATSPEPVCLLHVGLPGLYGSGDAPCSYFCFLSTPFLPCVWSHFSCVQLFDSTNCSPPRLFCPWDSPNKNTGVGYHALLQRIFETQGSNLCLLCFLHCHAGSLPLSHLGSLPFLNIYVIKHQLLVVLFIEKWSTISLGFIPDITGNMTNTIPQVQKYICFQKQQQQQH